MRRVTPLLLAMACAAPPAEEAFGEVDGTPFLAPGERLDEAFAERVRLVATPRARLTPDGPDLSPGAAVPSWPLVVVDPGPWPRVGLDVSGVRVLAYVDRASLEQRIVAPVPGAVELPPSKPVQVLEEDGDRLRVEARFEWWTATPWVPRRAVDEVWTSDPEPARREPLPDGERVALRPGAEILDEPGGDVVATIDEDPLAMGMLAVAVDEPDGDLVPIRFDDSGARVSGWAFEEDLVRNGPLFGYGCGCGHGIGELRRSGRFWTSATVPAGTPLYAGPQGPVVAMATADLDVPIAALDEGATISRETVVGRVDVWVAPEDVVP